MFKFFMNFIQKLIHLYNKNRCKFCKSKLKVSDSYFDLFTINTLGQSEKERIYKYYYDCKKCQYFKIYQENKLLIIRYYIKINNITFEAVNNFETNKMYIYDFSIPHMNEQKIAALDGGKEFSPQEIKSIVKNLVFL